VHGCGFLGSKPACALHYDINSQLIPRHFSRITIGNRTNFVTIYDQVIIFIYYRTREFAMYRVIACQIGTDFHITKVIDSNDFNITRFVLFIVGTKDVAANTAISVNCNPNGHSTLLLKKKYYPPLQLMLN
jgi:hypothetical protein